MWNHVVKLMRGACRFELWVAGLCVILAACNSRKSPEKKPAPRIESVQAAAHARPKSALPRQAGAAKKTKAPKEQDDTTQSQIVVFGRVTLADGSPASSATVQLLGNSGIWNGLTYPIASTPTQPDGTYRLRTDTTNAWQIRASQAGAASIMQSVMKDSQGSRSSSCQLEVNLVLLPASPVSGRIEDESGKPLPGIEIKAYAMSPGADGALCETQTSSSQTGQFVLDQLTSGEVTLRVDDERYVFLEQKENAPSEGVVLRLSSEGASARGTVRLFETEAGVDGATVTLHLTTDDRQYLGSRSTRTDSSGNFELQHLAAGLYRIEAQKDSLLLLPEEPGNQVLRLKDKESTEGVVLYLYPGHTVTGQVTDVETNTTLEHVKVSVAPLWPGTAETHSAWTQADGIYRIPGIGPARMSLVLGAEKKGYVTVEQSSGFAWVDIPGRKQLQAAHGPWNLRRDIRMQKAILISGNVQTEEGQPVKGAQVTTSAPSSTNSPLNTSCETDEQGAFEVGVSRQTDVMLQAKASGWPVVHSEPIRVDTQPVTGVKLVLRPAGSVSGTVVGPDDKPLQGAQVSATLELVVFNGTSTELQKQLCTDAQGAFCFENLPAGSYRLCAFQEGMCPACGESISLQSRERKTGIRIKLSPSHFIAGRVINEKGEPLPGAMIMLDVSFPKRYTQISKEQGRYRFEKLLSTRARLRVSCNGYEDLTRSDLPLDRDDVDLVLKKRRTSSKGVFTGKVIDQASRMPIADFEIKANYSSPRFTMQPGKPGVFLVEGLHEGAYPFQIKAKGYKTVSATAELPSGNSYQGKTYEMWKGARLSGRVVDRRSHEPLAGVDVQLKGRFEHGDFVAQFARPKAAAVTGSDGEFRFTDVDAGENFVAFRPPNSSSPTMESFVVSDAKDNNVGDVEIATGLVIRGKVLQDPSNEGVADVLVRLQISGSSSMGETRTDAQGAFEFTRLIAENYQLSLPNYNLDANADLRAKDEANVIFRLGACTLQGTVTQGGKPVQAWITLTGESYDASTQSDAEGRFELKRLSPGKYECYVRATGPGPFTGDMREQLELAPNQVLERAFLLPGGTLSGKVVGPSGETAEKTQLTLTRTAPEGTSNPVRFWPQQAESGSGGEFGFSGLSEGVYCLTAQKNGVGGVTMEGIQVGKEASVGPVTVKLSPDKGKLVSVVLSFATGEPIPEAWCNVKTSSGAQFKHAAVRDVNGMMEISDIPCGSYQVEVGAWGYSNTLHTVAIEKDRTVRLDDVLNDGGSLSWTLFDAKGKAAPDIPCRLTPQDPNSLEQEKSGVTDTSGIWTIRGVIPGSYTATALPPGKPPVSIQVVIVAAQNQKRETKME